MKLKQGVFIANQEGRCVPYKGLLQKTPALIHPGLVITLSNPMKV